MRINFDIRVDCLCEEEVWELFCQNVGEVVRLECIECLVKVVLCECGGLFLVIIIVGIVMRGKIDVKLWEYVLEQLSRFVFCFRSIEEKVFLFLKLSYDFLEEKLKFCFFMCVLFFEDYFIDVKEFVMYWIVEGFMDE